MVLALDPASGYELVCPLGGTSFLACYQGWAHVMPPLSYLFVVAAVLYVLVASLLACWLIFDWAIR